jgi:hypothetical protein
MMPPGELIEVTELGAGEEGVAKVSEGVAGRVFPFLVKTGLVKLHGPGEFVLGRGS